MSSTSINFSVDNNQLDTFCEQLVRRSRNLEKTHDSLATLQAFINRFSKDSQGSEDFQQVMNILNRHCDQSRQQLLSEKADLLVDALRRLSVSAVSDIYLPLSRNGFYEILQNISARLSPLELSIIADWSRQWLSYNKHKALGASRYPDAIDFSGTGISLQEYQAMTDLEHFMSSLAPAEEQGAA